MAETGRVYATATTDNPYLRPDETSAASRREGIRLELNTMTKHKTKGLPKRLPTDTVAHLAAVDLLENLDVSFWRASEHHLRIGDNLSYWPASGKMQVDGEKACRRERGKLALAALIAELRKLLERLKAKRAADKLEQAADEILRSAEGGSCRHSDELASLTNR